METGTDSGVPRDPKPSEYELLAEKLQWRRRPDETGRYLHVFMELNNTCNLKCRMCGFSDSRVAAVPRYHMPGSLFETIARLAGGVNIAFPDTRSDFVILMNEDVLVLPGCLRALHTALISGAVVAGPQFYWDRDCIFLLPCTEERTRRNELLKVAGKRSLAKLERARKTWREHARKHWRSRDAMQTTALSGALLAFRRDTWNTIGPLDDQFRLYYEENDWLLRAALAGLRSFYVPAAKAIHLHNPTRGQSPERLRWENESFVRFGNRYYGQRFMQRLFVACRTESVLPDWQAVVADAADAIVMHRSEESVWPLWVELTPSPLGFPAATTLMTDPKAESWRLPPMRGLEFLDGSFYVQLVDDLGRELCRYGFRRNAGPPPPS